MSEFDLSMFSGSGVPNVVGAQTKAMTLRSLARNQQMNYEDDAFKRSEREADALASQGLALVQRGSSWDDAMRQVGEVNPRAAQKMLAIRKADEGERIKMDYTVSQTEENRTKSEKTRFDMRLKGLDHLANVADEELRRGPDKLSLSRLQSIGNRIGVELPDIPEGTDINTYLGTLKASALDVKDRMVNDTTMARDAETARSHGANEALTAGRDAETRRAHGATEARLGRANDIAATGMRGMPEEIMVDGKPVLAIYDKRSGTFYDANTQQAIKGGIAPKGGGEKALTEVQGNATAFGMRMKDATSTINKLEASGEVDPSGALVRMSGGSGLLDVAPNAVAGAMNPKAQVYKQAQKNWVTANLRKESGAAIPVAEMKEEIAKWFPQMGDSPEVIAEKRASREVAERAMGAQAGRGEQTIANDPGGNRAPASGGTTFKSMPDPAKLNGRRVQDDEGNVYRSNGKSWVRE